MRLHYIAGLAFCLLCAAPAGAADTAAESMQPALTVQTSGQILPEYTILIGRNSAQTPLTASVYEKNGVLMVPLRPVAEQLGYTSPGTKKNSAPLSRRIRFTCISIPASICTSASAR